MHQDDNPAILRPFGPHLGEQEKEGEEEDHANKTNENENIVLRCENIDFCPNWLGQDASDLFPHPDGGDITEADGLLCHTA